MRICIDLDGTICRLRRPEQSYAEVEAMPHAVEKIRQFKNAGHYVIIYTARHMKTCNGNVGQVIARQGLVTLEWLERNGIPYDEIHFGKPHADVYLDDNAVRLSRWDEIADDGSNLPSSTEKIAAEQL